MWTGTHIFHSWEFTCYRVYQGSRRSVAVSVTLKKNLQKETFWEKPLHQTNSPHRRPPDETTVQVWNINEWAKWKTISFFFIQSSRRHTSRHGNHNPRQNTGKGCFFLLNPNHVVWIMLPREQSCLTEGKKKRREIHRAAVWQNSTIATMAYIATRLRQSWHYFWSVVRDGQNERVICFDSSWHVRSPTSWFSSHLRLCSFFSLFSQLASLISSYVASTTLAHIRRKKSKKQKSSRVRTFANTSLRYKFFTRTEISAITVFNNTVHLKTWGEGSVAKTTRFLWEKKMTISTIGSGSSLQAKNHSPIIQRFSGLSKGPRSVGFFHYCPCFQSQKKKEEKKRERRMNFSKGEKRF